MSVFRVRRLLSMADESGLFVMTPQRAACLVGRGWNTRQRSIVMACIVMAVGWAVVGTPDNDPPNGFHRRRRRFPAEYS